MLKLKPARRLTWTTMPNISTENSHPDRNRRLRASIGVATLAVCALLLLYGFGNGYRYEVDTASWIERRCGVPKGQPTREQIGCSIRELTRSGVEIAAPYVLIAAVLGGAALWILKRRRVLALIGVATLAVSALALLLYGLGQGYRHELEPYSWAEHRCGFAERQPTPEENACFREEYKRSWIQIAAPYAVSAAILGGSALWILSVLRDHRAPTLPLRGSG